MTSEESPADRVAVLVPCFNEEAAIEEVVRDFQEALPQADIYVYDNNSRDRTIALARAAGAIVRNEELQGKGNVVRRMFSDIDADIYVLVDGDATYSAASAPAMIELLRLQSLDMVVGTRVHDDPQAYRSGHRFGNALLTGFVSRLFGRRFTDMLSGYRVFSRRFVKSFPALSAGFEIETELTVHALQLGLPVSEVKTSYGKRPLGSESKLSTYRDGLRILRVILGLYRHEKPLHFFGFFGGCFAVLSLVLGVPIIIEWIHTGLVPRFPTAILATGTMVLAFLLATVGIVLQTVTLGRRELRRLVYLQIPSPQAPKAANARPSSARTESPVSARKPVEIN
jgi:glycosyltransferase involved in cell wall biosynthesis